MSMQLCVYLAYNRNENFLLLIFTCEFFTKFCEFFTLNILSPSARLGKLAENSATTIKRRI